MLAILVSKIILSTFLKYLITINMAQTKDRERQLGGRANLSLGHVRNFLGFSLEWKGLSPQLYQHSKGHHRQFSNPERARKAFSLKVRVFNKRK